MGRHGAELPDHIPICPVLTACLGELGTAQPTLFSFLQIQILRATDKKARPGKKTGSEPDLPILV